MWCVGDEQNIQRLNTYLPSNHWTVLQSHCTSAASAVLSPQGEHYRAEQTLYPQVKAWTRLCVAGTRCCHLVSSDYSWIMCAQSVRTVSDMFGITIKRATCTHSKTQTIVHWIPLQRSWCQFTEACSQGERGKTVKSPDRRRRTRRGSRSRKKILFMDINQWTKITISQSVQAAGGSSRWNTSCQSCNIYGGQLANIVFRNEEGLCSSAPSMEVGILLTDAMVDLVTLPTDSTQE